jgi:hypothetical protein
MLRTFGKYLWFAALVLAPNNLLASSDGKASFPEVTVSVHNDAGGSTTTLAQAEEVASGVFAEAGIGTHWVNCGTPARIGTESCRETSFPHYLHLRILPRARTLTPSIFGVSFLSEDGSGCYSDVFYAPIREMHDESNESLATILGHVMAHEIAHLLLGVNSHSSSGIMRAHWNKRDLISAGRGALLFTPRQADIMRARLSTESVGPRQSARTGAAALLHGAD